MPASSPSSSLRRVVITGRGVVSSLGNSFTDTWRGVLAGESGVGIIEQFDASGFPVNWAAEVKNFDARDYARKRKAIKLMDRKIQLAIAAAAQAGDDAGLGEANLDSTRFGSYLGTGLAAVAIDELGEALARDKVDDPADVAGFGTASLDGVSPLYLLLRLPNMVASHVSVHWDAQGPSNTITSDSAAGLQAVGEAFRWLAHGEADIVIAGGADSRNTPLGLHGLLRWDHLLSRTGTVDTPAEHRPFTRGRDGFVLGEAAGLLILEDYQHAKGRGANILGEIVGYGSATDPVKPGTATPDGAAMQAAMRKALADANLEATDIDAIFAAGLATESYDLAEANAIRSVLGEQTPVFCTKGNLGNTFAASGSLDVALALQAMREGVLPATRNLSAETLDPACALAHSLGSPRVGEYQTVMVNAIGLGGAACSVILQRG